MQSNYRYVIQLKVENYTRKVCDEITMNTLNILRIRRTINIDTRQVKIYGDNEKEEGVARSNIKYSISHDIQLFLK